MNVRSRLLDRINKTNKTKKIVIEEPTHVYNNYNLKKKQPKRMKYPKSEDKGYRKAIEFKSPIEREFFSNDLYLKYEQGESNALQNKKRAMNARISKYSGKIPEFDLYREKPQYINDYENEKAERMKKNKMNEERIASIQQQLYTDNGREQLYSQLPGFWGEDDDFKYRGQSYYYTDEDGLNYYAGFQDEPFQQSHEERLEMLQYDQDAFDELQQKLINIQHEKTLLYWQKENEKFARDLQRNQEKQQKKEAKEKLAKMIKDKYEIKKAKQIVQQKKIEKELVVAVEEMKKRNIANIEKELLKKIKELDRIEQAEMLKKEQEIFQKAYNDLGQKYLKFVDTIKLTTNEEDVYNLIIKMVDDKLIKKAVDETMNEEFMSFESDYNNEYDPIDRIQLNPNERNTSFNNLEERKQEVNGVNNLIGGDQNFRNIDTADELQQEEVNTGGVQIVSDQLPEHDEFNPPEEQGNRTAETKTIQPTSSPFANMLFENKNQQYIKKEEVNNITAEPKLIAQMSINQPLETIEEKKEEEDDFEDAQDDFEEDRTPEQYAYDNLSSLISKKIGSIPNNTDFNLFINNFQGKNVNGSTLKQFALEQGFRIKNYKDFNSWSVTEKKKLLLRWYNNDYNTLANDFENEWRKIYKTK